MERFEEKHLCIPRKLTFQMALKTQQFFLLI